MKCQEETNIFTHADATNKLNHKTSPSSNKFTPMTETHKIAQEHNSNEGTQDYFFYNRLQEGSHVKEHQQNNQTQ